MIKWDKPCYKCLSHFCDLSCEEPKHLQAPQRKPLTDEQGEPAAYVNGDALDNMLDDRLAFIQRTKSGYRATPLYTTPPQRTWAWLTAEQKVALCKKFPDHLTFNAIEAIEDQLKQNNGFA